MCAHLWERLSPEDHADAVPTARFGHGACFSWLESQINEHGAMTWNALRERMLEEAPELVRHHADGDGRGAAARW
jgi:hypothetical protein